MTFKSVPSITQRLIRSVTNVNRRSCTVGLLLHIEEQAVADQKRLNTLSTEVFLRGFSGFLAGKNHFGMPDRSSHKNSKYSLHTSTTSSAIYTRRSLFPLEFRIVRIPLTRSTCCYCSPELSLNCLGYLTLNCLQSCQRFREYPAPPFGGRHRLTDERYASISCSVTYLTM